MRGRYHFRCHYPPLHPWGGDDRLDARRLGDDGFSVGERGADLGCPSFTADCNDRDNFADGD